MCDGEHDARVRGSIKANVSRGDSDLEATAQMHNDNNSSVHDLSSFSLAHNVAFRRQQVGIKFFLVVFAVG